MSDMTPERLDEIEAEVRTFETFRYMPMDPEVAADLIATVRLLSSKGADAVARAEKAEAERDAAQARATELERNIAYLAGCVDLQEDRIGRARDLLAGVDADA